MMFAGRASGKPNESSSEVRSRWRGTGRYPSRTMVLGIGIVALLAASGVAAACGQGGHGGGGKPPAVCSVPGKSPAALQIGSPVPTKGIPAGGSLSVTYQVEIRNFTSNDSGSIVHFPSVYITFPLSPSGTQKFYFVPTNVTVTSAGWFNVSTKSVTFGSNVSFPTGGKATLSTVSIAVMINSTDPNATIEVQWSWTANRLGPTTTHVTVPTGSPTKPNLPSIFQPAAWVSLDATTNTTAKSGGLFELKLDGAVGKTTFRTSLEYANGTEIRCSVQTNYKLTDCFIVGVPLYYANFTGVAPGNYLIHVHDANGSIVHTVSITVVSGHSWWWGSGSTLSCACSSGGGSGGGWGHHGRGGW